MNSNRKIILDETFEYAFQKRTTFAMPTIDRKKRPQSKTQVSQSLLRVTYFILLFFLNFHETSVNRGLLLPYIPYFFLYTFCSNKRAQLRKCFHTSLIFLEKCFEYIIISWFNIDFWRKYNSMRFLTNWRAAENFWLDHSFFMIFLKKFLTTRNKLARAARKFFEYIIVFSWF